MCVNAENGITVMWVQPPGEKWEYNLDGSHVNPSKITQSDKTILTIIIFFFH